ncbi:hypothetical protein OSB04_014666 [Centaurea solstitialis]|uniref:Inositol polyphosphate-related phosphatase domain-containing protein n=1 Tax=Centaurea solstitialis TaxID=347529 RepID=A0AA38TAX8_9ASTR|nr:hypothetical protein OSB04_014666 [Centaurea solstitialis]
MRDGNSKTNKFSWSRKLVRKWFNIKSKTEESEADNVVSGGGDGGWMSSFCEREPPAIKKTKTEKSSKSTESRRWGRADLDHPQVINVQNYSIFSATWNVGGKSPSSKMNLDDWLHAAPPADIYVLGFQEIVPLNAANILGAEDNGPAKRWLALIRKTLNNRPGAVAETEITRRLPFPIRLRNTTRFRRLDEEQKLVVLPSSVFSGVVHSWRNENDSSMQQQPHLDRRYSVCDRAIFGHRPSDCSSSHRPSDYSSSSHRPRTIRVTGRVITRITGRVTIHLTGRVITLGAKTEWGSSDDDYGPTEDSQNTNSVSPMSNWGSNSVEDGYRMPGQSSYCLVASKQMCWVRSELREHVRNLKRIDGISRKKGSVSVSMLLHQTSFCFVCTHLTSGEKEGDELRRNSDFMEIVKKTRFPPVQGVKDEKSPETILEHDRIIWLGDLNYRIALSYRSAKALVEMQNWRALLEKDQLRIEQRRGRVFQGWNEGRIYFPPTYKYLTNSDRYTGDNLHHKEKRRTPAWCDRILWYGRGLHQLSYVRGESRFSDHRPVYSLFWAEVELVHSRFRRSMSCSSSRIEVEELLPYANGYTELCFF